MEKLRTCYHDSKNAQLHFFFYNEPSMSAVDAVETSFEGKKTRSIKDIRYEEACNRLAVEAVKRGCTDNVTVMIVDIASKDSENTTHL